MMELKVIGTGSEGNCYLLKDHESYLSLDAGAKYKDVQVGCDFKVGKIAGCLVTHAHKDHCQQIPKYKKAIIDCFSGADAIQPIARATGTLIFGLKDRKWNPIAAWSVLPFEVPHENEPNYGYLIESPSGHKLMYLTDFEYCRYTFRRMHLNTILIACNHLDDITDRQDEIIEKRGKAYFEHIVRGHSSLAVVKTCIEANKTEDLRNVILCHLSEENASADKMQRAIKKLVGKSVAVHVATKGKVINLE